jgi:hypothetical protein
VDPPQLQRSKRDLADAIISADNSLTRSRSADDCGCAELRGRFFNPSRAWQHTG